MPVAPCPPPTPVTPGVVIFEFSEFIGIYPEFATANSMAAQNNFNIATLTLNNCCSSIVFDPNVRMSLLYMLTAHITYLNTPCGANNNQPPGIVGRINSAAEGSVSVSAEMPGATMSSAYFLQTKYGTQFWQSTAQFRTMLYVPALHNTAFEFPIEGIGANLGPVGTGFLGYNGGSS